MGTTKEKIRLTRKEKKRSWYISEMNRFKGSHVSGIYSAGEIGHSQFADNQVNYDMFNNKVIMKQLLYVCQPHGTGREYPATMRNFDISSGKIRTLLGMEIKRGSSWKFVATNPDATNRKEEIYFNKVRQFTVDTLMQPLREEAEIKFQQETQGRQLNENEIKELREKLSKEMENKTPIDVEKYMNRKHQDPAEIMFSQLLEYLVLKNKMDEKFNRCFKHFLLSAKSVMYVGMLNGEPYSIDINSQRVNYAPDNSNKSIQDRDWATCEHYFSNSDIIKYFGSELKKGDLDKILHQNRTLGEKLLAEGIFNHKETEGDKGRRVLHCVWKSLRKIGFLTYIDEEGTEQERIVDEDYIYNEQMGDIDIKWEWLNEIHEGWDFGDDIYAYLRPLPGQFTDPNNLGGKLPYFGVICDNMNSEPVALMSRLRTYQHYLNIIMYRLELVMAKDKGKNLLLNINAVSGSSDVPTTTFEHLLDATGVGYLNPNEEGVNYNDINALAKVIDRSRGGEISYYINLAEYIKRLAGESVGITPDVEGQIAKDAAVSNTRQNIVQKSYILEYYFNLHERFKQEVLTHMLELSRFAYSGKNGKKLTYVVDQMTKELLINEEYLTQTTFGLFLSNSLKTQEAQDTIRQLAHAALQNQRIEFSDILVVLRQNGIKEATEQLQLAESRRRKMEQNLQQQQIEAKKEEQARLDNMERQRHRDALEMQSEEYRLKTELAITENALVGMSYNPDIDKDRDGKNDFLEIAKFGVDADVTARKLTLEEDKLKHQKQVDNKKLSLEKQKVKSK